MVKQYRFYYRLFTLKFVIRAFFVKILRLYAGEVKQLDIADELLTRAVSVESLQTDRDRITLSIDINHTRLKVVLRKNTSDLLVFHQVLMKEAYQTLVELVNSHYRGTVRTIVDVGGNIGLAALFFKCYFDDASIFVVEPSPLTFGTLEHNLKANGVSARAFQKAVLPAKGRVKIDKTFRDKQDWSTQVIPTNSPSGIEAVSFSEFRRHNRITTIDILKIDIEGHEADLFRSKDFLAELRTIRFLALEVHEEKADRISIINELQDQGFIIVYKGETIFGFNPAAL